MEAIKNRINKLITIYLGAKSEEITPESLFADDLGADSLDDVEMVMALEEEFEIEIEDDICMAWRTVGDVYDYFTSK